MSYYRTCPHCGANLDPGEICDCIASLSPEGKAVVDGKIHELLEKQKTTRGADNTTGGEAEQTLTGPVSASYDN